ncbi:hypothetical protein AAES_30744 [Amazona aestiva]|uniref:Activin types I and II receptor domain-containing protein n=1 Tax=Amazona aestiva TaxID=12930 RepID=A0A0Q3VBE2_AMAAE|nr:hypothetical protein AAES_30744 [Amazona aestiva]
MKVLFVGLTLALCIGVGKVTLYYQQGCTSAMNCGRERASDAESRLTSRYSCCETDLCNEEWDEDPTD